MQTRKLKALVSLLLLPVLAAACAPAAPPKPPSEPPVPAAVATSVPAPAATPAASAERPRYGGILTLVRISEPQMLDPHQEASVATLVMTRPATNSLVQRDPLNEDRIIGDLAKSWDISPDGLVYTFRLQEGVKFHNGYPATAEDAKYSLERMARPPKGVKSPREMLFRNIERMDAVDSHTLRITLKQPQASLLDILTMEFNAILSQRFIEEQKGNITWNLVGSGPFKLKDYVRGVSLEYDKNPDYFVAGRPYLDGLKWYIIADPAAIQAALRTGQLMIVPNAGSRIPPMVREVIRKEVPQIEILDFLQVNVTQVTFNTKRKPWDDVRVRKAVDLVIDRQAAIKVIMQGDGAVGGYLMPGTPWATPREDLLKRPGIRQPKDQDIAEAKRLMAEAGYAGQTIKTTFSTRNYPPYPDIAVLVKGEVAKLGIDATVKLVDMATMSKLLFAHDMDVLPYAEGFASYDPDAIYGDFYVTGALRNYGEWSDPKVDNLYTEQSRTVDPAKRVQLVREMERLAMEGVPRANLYWMASATLKWPQMRNFVQPNSIYLNLQWQDVWLAQ